MGRLRTDLSPLLLSLGSPLSALSSRLPPLPGPFGGEVVQGVVTNASKWVGCPCPVSVVQRSRVGVLQHLIRVAYPLECLVVTTRLVQVRVRPLRSLAVCGLDIVGAGVAAYAQLRVKVGLGHVHVRGGATRAHGHYMDGLLRDWRGASRDREQGHY